MKIEVIAGRELSDEHVVRWAEIQDANPDLASPYFCPGFTQAVAAVRDDVFVAVLRDAGEIAGFFPFQRTRMRSGAPVGGQLSDFHGLIADRDMPLDGARLLRECGISAFEFHHMLADQTVFRPYQQSVTESHFVDLTEGFDGYAEALRRAGSHVLKDVRAKLRRLTRDFGPVRFEPHCDDPHMLELLFRWKSDQYRRSGLVDVFAFEWTRALLRRIHAMQTPRFAGILSVLHVGDEIAALHMGMRSQCVWNWWFPRHDERFAKGSPGIVLRVSAAEAAPALGVTRIDLGMGGQDTYKPRLRTGSIPLAEGRVEVPSFATAMRKLRRDTEMWIRRSPLMPLARIPGRLLKQAERRRRFQ